MTFPIVRDVEFRRGVVRRLRLISADSDWVVLEGRWSITKRSLVEIGNLGAGAPEIRQADLLMFVYHKHSPPACSFQVPFCLQNYLPSYLSLLRVLDVQASLSEPFLVALSY